MELTTQGPPDAGSTGQAAPSPFRVQPDLGLAVRSLTARVYTLETEIKHLERRMLQLEEAMTPFTTRQTAADQQPY